MQRLSKCFRFKLLNVGTYGILVHGFWDTWKGEKSVNTWIIQIFDNFFGSLEPKTLVKVSPLFSVRRQIHPTLLSKKVKYISSWEGWMLGKRETDIEKLPPLNWTWGITRALYRIQKLGRKRSKYSYRKFKETVSFIKYFTCHSWLFYLSMTALQQYRSNSALYLTARIYTGVR